MKRLISTLLAASILVLGTTATVAAQEGQGEDTRIVLVDFDTSDVDEAVTEEFYGQLRNLIADADDRSVASGGTLSMGDILLMVGCDTPSPDCLSMAADFVEGEQLLYGSIQRSNDVHMFSIEIFDFPSGQVVDQISDQTVQGDEAWVKKAIPAVIEHLLYGETGALDIEVADGSEAEIRVNGDVVGTGSAQVENVAPGEVVVTAVSADGQKDEARLILRHEAVETVRLSLDPAVADLDGADFDFESLLVPGLAASGIGVVGLVVGIVGQAQLSGAESEANSLVGGEQAIASSDLARAQQLQSDMNSANTLRILGFTAGSLSLVAGGAMLFLALTQDSTGPDSDELAVGSQNSWKFDLQLTGQAVGAGLTLEF